MNKYQKEGMMITMDCTAFKDGIKVAETFVRAVVRRIGIIIHAAAQQYKLERELEAVMKKDWVKKKPLKEG